MVWPGERPAIGSIASTRDRPADVQATFCATLVDELVAAGVRHAVVAPGSRSTPMALALAGRPELAVHVVHDERSAAFVALGIGLGGTPAVLLCTSGTAAANFHPGGRRGRAVRRADARADRRPPARAARRRRAADDRPDPPVRPVGALVPRSRRARAPATRRCGARSAPVPSPPRPTGPVHLNLPFREPFVGRAGGSCRRARRLTVPAIAGAGAAPCRRRLVDAPASRPRARPRRCRVAARADVERVRRRHRLAGARRRRLRTPRRARCRHDVRRPPAPRRLRRRDARGGRPPRPAGGVEGAGPVGRRLRRHRRAGRRTRHDRPRPPRRRSTRRVRAGAARSGAGPGRRHRLARPLARRRRPPPRRPSTACSARRRRSPSRPSPASSPAPARPVRRSSWRRRCRCATWSGSAGSTATDPRQPRRQRDRRRGVDRPRRRPATGGPTVAVVGDIAFVHDAGALTALRAAARPTCASSSSTTTAAASSRSCRRQPQLPGERFEQLFGTPHGTDVVAPRRRPRARRGDGHDGGRARRAAPTARTVGHPCRHRPGRERRRPRRR